MKPSNDLHELIHSLSPNEKGYFKKHCQRGGSGSLKYLKLFDAIAAQENYDEEKVKAKLKDPVLVRNLSSEKNYLFHLIIEAMLYGNTARNEVAEYELLFAKAKWLSTHSFYEMAVRFCTRIRTWCLENEMFTLLLDTLDLELLLWQYTSAESRRAIEAISADRSFAIHALDVSDRLRMLDMNVIRLFQEKGIGRDAADIDAYRKLHDEANTIAQNEKDLPVKARVYLKNIHVFFHNVNSEAEKSMDDLEELIALMESKPIMKKEKLSFWLSSVNNLILLLLYLKRYDEAEQKIELLEQTVPETQGNRNTSFVTRYNTRFDLYTAKHDWAKAYELTKTLKQELPSFEGKIDNRYTGHIRFAAFRSCFYAGHLRDALSWINTIVQKQKGEPFKTEIVTIARIAELTVHETMGHYDMLENLVRSAERFLEKTNSLYSFEEMMIRFFREQINVHPKKTALLKLRENLLSIEKDLMEQRVFSYFDFRSWVNARLENRSIAESLSQ